MSLPRLLALLGVLAAPLVASPPALAGDIHCGDTITQNTRLDADLVNCPGDGIVIGADHVTLDLNGHTVDGQGAGTGVSAASRQDVTVVRGAIQGFAEGVALSHVAGATVRNLGLDGNGISCTFSEGCTIEGNAVYGAGIAVVNTGTGTPTSVRRNVVRGAEGAGIAVNFTASETTVSKNVVEDNAVGIEALHSSVGQIADNTIRSNDAQGILGSLGGDTVIKRNLIWRNGGDGLSLDQFVDVRIFSNYIAGNRANGIRGETLARPMIEDNVVSRNLANGILLDGVAPDRESTSFAQLIGNVTSKNAMDGIALTSATHGSALEDNRAIRNGDDGFDVASPGTTVSDNRARHNADLGIEAAAGVVDGGGNRAKRNRDRRQCVNVRCR